jgi:site-specific recombinase XerD
MNGTPGIHGLHIPDPCSHAAACCWLRPGGNDTRTLQAFMGHRSIANTVVYTAVADKRIRNIWGK